ncbi:MAG: PilT/PilU family type 4a pilus ATPase [Phycisphaerales bacterium]|nr:PilT/PilU family type 4a pilus ATPase [Phycisphaerales bacterium]
MPSFDGPSTIRKLLTGMAKHMASDLHLKVGLPPIYRIDRHLRPLGMPALGEEDTEYLLQSIIPEKIRHRYDEAGDLDFSTVISEKDAQGEEIKGDRFRCNIFKSSGAMHAAIRRVQSNIPTFTELNLPPIYQKMARDFTEGMVLIVGVTGCGKSSTIASMVEHINQIRHVNIITVEDPIEFVFTPKKSVISQRELGLDTPTYASALRYIVRQDPDVIFIGELRDHDTVLSAIQAAETGHLVFGSLHTADTMQAFARMLEFFPRHEHEFIRSSLSNSLASICAQRLMPRTSGGVIPATEVLLNNSVVREKIRAQEDEDLPAIVNNSTGEGMRSFTYSLKDLVERDEITLSTAMEYAPNRDALRSVLKGVEVQADTGIQRIKG